MTSCDVNMKKVNEIRTAKGWKVVELANKAKVSVATLFALQAGRRKASLVTVNRLANALQIPVDDIKEN